MLLCDDLDQNQTKLYKCHESAAKGLLRASQFTRAACGGASVKFRWPPCSA